VSSEVVVQMVMDEDGCLTVAVRAPVASNGASPHYLTELVDAAATAFRHGLESAAEWMGDSPDDDGEDTEADGGT
jgi:hypothetical protein